MGSGGLGSRCGAGAWPPGRGPASPWDVASDRPGTGHAFLDDPKERVQGLEVGEFSDRRHRASSTAQAAAVRRAKSAKLAGAAPVAFSTSLLGREP